MECSAVAVSHIAHYHPPKPHHSRWRRYSLPSDTRSQSLSIFNLLSNYHIAVLAVVCMLFWTVPAHWSHLKDLFMAFKFQQYLFNSNTLVCVLRIFISHLLRYVGCFSQCWSFYLVLRWQSSSCTEYTLANSELADKHDVPRSQHTRVIWCHAPPHRMTWISQSYSHFLLSIFLVL